LGACVENTAATRNVERVLNVALDCLFVHQAVLFHERIKLVIENDALYLIMKKEIVCLQ